MTRCDYCGSMILFGGVRESNLRFCNRKCHGQGEVLILAQQVPEDMLSEAVLEIHQGDCPRCGGMGPVDVHTSHVIWSAVLFTSWHSRPHVCCRSCGVKSKLGAAVFSGALGWWGVPWGLIFTPIQVLRNVLGLFSSPDPTRPSAQLENIARTMLAAQAMQMTPQERPEESV